MNETAGGFVQPEEQTGSDRSTPAATPKLWQVIFIAVVAIVFTAVWLVTYEFFNTVIWMNDFVKTNRWMIPVGVLFFSLLVGLTQKYLHAPTVIHGGVVESIKGGSGQEIDYRTFPGTMLSSFFSLFSGASVGPEGPIAFLIQDISVWMRMKLRISRESALGFDVAALSSAYNGIIGSPVFTAVFATEVHIRRKDALLLLAWNLLAGVIGYLFFSLLGLPVFAKFIPFTPIKEMSILYVLYAIILGVVGALLAIFLGLSMQGFEKIMKNTFKDRVVLRTLSAGVVIAIVCYYIPEVMFSGESQIHTIIANPVQFGVAMLLFMAILKILLLGLSFKSGYLGGPVFPTMFSCTMIALALSLLFPGVPVAILVMCIEASAIALALGAPLSAIFLVALVGTADPYMIVLLVLSAVVGMIVGAGFKELMAQRVARKTKMQPT